MTAPDMVSVIEKVIVTHWAETIAAEGDGFWIKCRCGSIGEVESDAEDWEPANEWLAAHQAAAVMAALHKAGTVEWGVKYMRLGLDGAEVHVLETNNKDHAESVAELGQPRIGWNHRAASRLTFPWQEVERG